MVAVGGLGRVTGVFFAALLIGVLDFVLKIDFPKGGTMFIYALTLVLLLLARRRACSASMAHDRARCPPCEQLAERHRLRWWEALPWVAAIAAFFLFPELPRASARRC